MAVGKAFTPKPPDGPGDLWGRQNRSRGAQRAFQRVARASRATVAAPKVLPAPKAHSGLVVAAYLSVRKDGRLVQLHLPGCSEPPDCVRGEIDGFSAASRRRLMELLHSLRRDARLPIFGTLTFPEEVWLTAREAKKCMIAWTKRMRRLVGERWSYVWRLEAHPEMSRRTGRMCPHLHLISWGAWFDLAELSAVWTSVVWDVLKIGDCLADAGGRMVREKHQASGTNFERCRTWGGVIYAGKNYIAKEEEFPLGEDSGRIWGYHNRAGLPLAVETRIALTWAEATCARINVEAWMREKRIESEHLVCTFFTDDPDLFVKRLLYVIPGSMDAIHSAVPMLRPASGPG